MTEVKGSRVTGEGHRSQSSFRFVCTGREVTWDVWGGKDRQDGMWDFRNCFQRKGKEGAFGEERKEYLRVGC